MVSPRALLDKHLALVSAVSIVFFATTRVYFFSGFNLTTSLAVLTVVNQAQLLAGTLLWSVLLIFPIALMQPEIRRWAFEGSAPGASFAVSLRTSIIFLTLGSMIWTSVTVSLLFGFLLGTLTLIIARVIRAMKHVKQGIKIPDGRPYLISQRYAAWVAATLIGMLLLQILLSPWLPKEQINLDSANQPQKTIGYLMGSQDGMSLILTEHKVPLWVKSDEISSRQVCKVEHDWWQSNLNLFDVESGAKC